MLTLLNLDLSCLSQDVHWSKLTLHDLFPAAVHELTGLLLGSEWCCREILKDIQPGSDSK
jgi:hypothetical protein